MIFVTGGAGFIGSNFILDWLAHSGAMEPVVNYDKLTYAGNLHNLSSVKQDGRHIFVQGDICDTAHVTQLLEAHRPRAVLHFAAESHVDRSILGPDIFVTTNVNGTFSMLTAVHAYWSKLPGAEQRAFRFLQVSTDEVYGSLGPDDAPFCETSAYAPNSPYAASKAAADHFVRAYGHTYGLPVLTVHCSNNYGPRQLPEKFIPLLIVNALAGKSLPVYGDGLQIRDWLYVKDHCAALRCVLEKGAPGATYNIGGRNEKTNLEVVHTICDILDRLAPKTREANSTSYRRQIVHVQDRPGHDRRYAIDARKIESELGWTPTETFESGIGKTVQWYLNHQDWVRNDL